MTAQTKILFSKHLKDINNRLGNDITLLTVCDSELLEKGDYITPDEMKKYTYQESMNPDRNHYKVMEDLAAKYGVSLPGLVLIDTTEKGPYGKEQCVVVSYGESDAEAIYRHILSTVNAVRDFYGDFYRIAAQCKGTVSFHKKPLDKDAAMYKSFEEIVKKHLKDKLCTQKQLATALHINEKTLRRYLQEWDTKTKRSYPLPRDTAIAIAFVLKLTPKEADEMFDAALVEAIPRLGTSERDAVIRSFMGTGIPLDDVNKELRRRGLQTVRQKVNNKNSSDMKLSD